MNDLKLALYLLFKRPGSTALIVGMLTFGIAGNTAIFSVFNGLFLEPLPFPEAHRLVDVDETAPKWDLEFVSVAYPDFEQWREHNRSFEALAVYDDDSVNLTLTGEARRVKAARVTHDMAAVLRFEPLLGRHFTPEEDQPGGPKVALLTQGLWAEQFGASPGIVGETVLLDSEAHTVIGVLPPEAVFLGDADLWVPLATSTDENAGSWYLSALGRLNPGVTPDTAREDLHRIHKNMIESRPVNDVTSPVVTPVVERLLGDYRQGTVALLAAVGVVLLMACANIAGLMLARSASRRREIGIRLALGAARGRIIRQLMTESLVLATIGGLLGVALGFGAVRFLVQRVPQEVPRWIRFDLDTRFLLISLTVVMGSAIVFGLAPALQAARTDVQQVLGAATGRATASSARSLRSRLLVVSEVALALVLLTAAGFLIRSFHALSLVDPGFRPEGVLTYRLSLPAATYEESDQKIDFFTRHLQDVRALPGVDAAGAVNTAPLGNHEGWFFTAEGAVPKGPDEKNPVVLTRAATPDYFRAMGITLLSGRLFDDNDGRAETQRVAIVNESFTRTFWADADAVGKRIRANDGEWMTVVGLTKDVRHYGLETEMRPGVYLPFRGFARSTMTVVVRTTLDPHALVAPARESARKLDPSIPIYRTATMSERLDESLWTRRASSWLLTSFAGFALTLAVAGLYGVVSFAVSQRAREIGIRMAVGARHGQVLKSVMKQGMVLVAVGVALGLPGAVGVGRLLSSSFYGMDSSGIGVYGLVTLILVSIALLANWFPARRAAGIDPMTVLRTE